MRSRDAFSACHPAVNLIYFALVLLFGMAFTDPLCLLASFAGALSYTLYLRGRGARPALLYLLPLMLLAALINPAFSHEGATTLAYLPSGNPLTLESVLYGLAAAFMLGAVLLWFSCITEVFTSDKLVFLFGRVSPALSMVLTMILRFVPQLGEKISAIRRACIGAGLSPRGGALARIRESVVVISAALSESLESAAATADSMKSRGYGLPGRSAYSAYRLDGRDRAILCWLGFCAVYIILGYLADGMYWRWYPTVRGETGAFALSLRLCCFLLYATPLCLDLWEDRKWKRLRQES